MRIKILMIMLLPLLLTECQTLSWTMLTRKDSRLYSEVEKAILNETTASIDFKFGYDPDLDMDYVFKAGSFTDKEINSKSGDMKKVLLKYNPKEVISFYEKTLQMKETQTWKMNYFKDRKKWVDFTYLQKYSLPETEQYLAILEKNTLVIDAAYSEKVEKRKKDIKRAVAYNLLKEIKDKERKIREERRPAWK